MSAKLSYAYDEIVAEHDYAERIRRDGVVLHGGLDRQGKYLSPRSLHRPGAISTWTEALAARGLPTEVIGWGELQFDVFPNAAQAKCLLRRGARGAMTRILTLIGITEGFGNDGIRALPPLDFQRYFKESVDGTCLAHLYKGLLEAHGNEEAGRGDEVGHDGMWYVIRDAALDHPPVTPDMYDNIPIAPPPGYTGPAKPAAEAMSANDLAQRLFPTLDPLLEIELGVFAQILSIEIIAYTTFAWAKDVLSDPECSAAPELAPWLVDCIQQDENLHVGYLQCALAEARGRTFLDLAGAEIPGAQVIDAVAERVVRQQKGGRRERLLKYRMRQIREELESHPQGASILREFERLGPSPA
jgi:hypothetical protein